MEEVRPCTGIKWRPLNAPGVTKNVMIAANANGTLTHYHTTSGKQLNQIPADGLNQLLCCDYKPDGHNFITAGKNGVIYIYDEQTR
jgi:WD40 repeat protein